MTDPKQQRHLEIGALIVAARSDREAFGQLYEAYYERILGYCLRRLNQSAAAEDVCGEAFLYVARKMQSFRGETEQDFRRWVYRIATNEVNAYLRRNLRRKELWDDALQQKRLRASRPTNPNEPDDSPIGPLVHLAIRRLHPKQQTIVTVRLLEELPYDEIAQILNVRPGTVRVTYSRAIKKLRDWLSKEMIISVESPTRRE